MASGSSSTASASLEYEVLFCFRLDISGRIGTGITLTITRKYTALYNSIRLTFCRQTLGGDLHSDVSNQV
jgi:hypothetical protein